MNTEAKVLVVDDDRLMVRTLCDILKIRGYETETAFTGSEAVEKARTTRPCCVLMDFRMPELDGIGALKIIRQSMPELPVLLMSAYMTEEQTEEAGKSGANAVLRKPLDIREVLSFLSGLMEEKRPPVEGRDEWTLTGRGETEGAMVMSGRKFLRIPIDNPVRIRPMDEDLKEIRESAGKCRDISVAGMGFICGIFFPVGARIEIDMQIAETAFTMKAEVVRVTGAGGEYDHGVRFLLDDPATAKMLEELALV